MHILTVLALSSAWSYESHVFLSSLTSIFCCMINAVTEKHYLSANVQLKIFILKKNQFFLRLSKAATFCETHWPMFVCGTFCVWVRLLTVANHKSQQLAKTYMSEQPLWFSCWVAEVQYYLVVLMPEICAAVSGYASVSFTLFEVCLSAQLVANYQFFLDKPQNTDLSSFVMPVTMSCSQEGINMQNIVTLLVMLMYLRAKHPAESLPV